MAKKQFGKLAVLAALAGTAVGITYFLRYKSFHEELEEDFHDFEENLTARRRKPLRSATMFP